MSTPQHPLSRQIRVLIGIGTFALTLAGVAAFQLRAASGPAFHGTPYPDTPIARDFTLTDHTGSTTSLSDFRGHPVLLFFGFTECPDFCPLTLARLSEVAAEGGAELADTRILLVTVDPETDTPEALARYVSRFGGAVVGLTGDEAELQRVFGDYGVYAERREGHGGETALAHTTVVFGIDRGGRLRVLIHPEDTKERVAEDVRALASIGG